MLICIDDKLAGANTYTLAAVDALVVINGSKIVGDSDSAGGAVLLTKCAADAADIADLTELGSLLMRRTAYENSLGFTDKGDDMSGAGVDAFAASLTLCAVDFSNAVYDMNGIVGASLYTCAKTEAAISAFERAVCNFGCCKAVLNAVILILALGIDTAAAVYVGDKTFGRSGLDTHDLGDCFGTCLASYGAAIYLSFAAQDSICHRRASGIAAAAAVGAGQGFNDLVKTRIAVNVEDLRAIGKKQSEKEAKAAQNKNGHYKCLHYLQTSIKR